MAVRTWAPRGQTPVLRVPLTRDHLIFDQWHHARWATVPASAPSFLRCASSGRRASRVLLRKISGKILLIWDGSPIHRGHEIKDFLKRGAAKRLHLEQLPGYAPDLNPDEGIWNSLKRVELGNVCCRDLQHLSTELLRARERLRHKREVIRRCSQQCGYSV